MMTKTEIKVIFVAGFVLMMLFTFTDLTISMEVYDQHSMFGRLFEAVGELPFYFFTVFGFMLFYLVRERSCLWLNLIWTLVSWWFIVNMGMYGGRKICGYMKHFMGQDVQEYVTLLLCTVLIIAAYLIARAVPRERYKQAMIFVFVVVLYFVLLTIVVNSLKYHVGRMRFREMEDPLNQFTRWYVMNRRNPYGNEFASFPSGHTARAASAILVTMLPSIVPGWSKYQNYSKLCAYRWMLLTAVSRVRIGAHFASDVTAGLLISLFLFLLCKYIVEWLYNKKVTADL